MKFNLNDGGRHAAGFLGRPRDCVCRAIAIATRQPYRWVYDQLNLFAKSERPRNGKMSSARNGVSTRTIRRYMESIGWKWTPTMQIGTGCRVHLNEEELPKGNLVVALSRHYTAVIDGVVNDTYDPSRDGTRCVYGYFSEGT